MASSRQSDLFQQDDQSDLFGEDTPTSEYRADSDSVRAELYKILAEARAAQKLPWEPKTVRLYRTIFPQMTNWLPDEEGAQLRFEFETEKRNSGVTDDRCGACSMPATSIQRICSWRARCRLCSIHCGKKRKRARPTSKIFLIFPFV